MGHREQVISALYNNYRYRARIEGSRLDLGSLGSALFPHVLPADLLASLVEDLLAEGLVVREGEGLDLHPSALLQAREVYRASLADAFGDWLTRAEESKAHQQLCAEVHETGLFQFDMLDQRQIEALIEVLSRGGEPIIDLGCATGALTEHIARRTGARVHGIDIAPKAIARAQQRLVPGLSFEALAIEDWRAEPGSVGAVTALDTVYFVEDLQQLVSNVRTALRPGGIFVSFLSAHAQKGAPMSSIDPEQTPLGAALFSSFTCVEVSEFTAETHAYWRRSAAALARLQPLFQAEGSTDLWESRRRETETTLASHDAGRSRRWMYTAHA